MKFSPLLLCLALLLPTFALRGAEPTDPSEKYPNLNLIPWPKAVEMGQGKMRLGPTVRIAAAQPQLRPLAEILAGELSLAAGVKTEVVPGTGQAGDIRLAIDATLKAGEPIRTIRDRQLVQTTDGAHTLVITDRAAVTGFDYRAVAEGTATLLQAIARDEQGLYLPALRIKDWPHADYCAAMLDVGRQDHPIEAIKQMIEMCRLYKVRYLHLHLTDDQGWTFPSTKYPQIGTRNSGAHGGKAPRVYKLQDLKDAVAYGDARGVALVPEFEMPGHSGAARRCMPEVFSAIHPKTGKAVDIGVMNLANEALYPVLDTLIGEMCDVFRSSPYFHIGTDECETNGLPVHAGFKAFLAKHGLKNENEVATFFINQVNAMIAKRGKKTIKWEGVGDEACKDVILMCWVGNNRTAERLVHAGFTVITCPWNLGIPWPQWSMYFCNGSALKRTDAVIGATTVMWEQTPERHLSMARRGFPERQERTWGPDNHFTEDGFGRRWNGTDALAAKLVGLNELKYPATIGSSLPGVGLIEPLRAFDAPQRCWQDESGESTWFQSCRPPVPGDHLTVTFDRPRTIWELAVATGHNGHDRLAQGELQTSADGQAFKTVAAFQDGTARAAVVDAVKAVRIRCTAAQAGPLAIDDIKLSLISRISGTVNNLDAIGAGNLAVLSGDTTIPNLGNCRVNFLNKGFVLTLGTGGGKACALEGMLGGAGTVEFLAGAHSGGFRDSPLALVGDRPNNPAATYRVKQGRLALGKRDGVAALGGKIIVGGQGSNDGLFWINNNQIDDRASVELLDSAQGGAYLDLNGHSEKFNSLAMAAHTRIVTGTGILRINRLTVVGRELPAGIYAGGEPWCQGPGMILVGDVRQREVSGPIDATPGSPSVALLKGPTTLRLVADCGDVFRTENYTLSLTADGKKPVRLSGFILGNGNLTIAAADVKSPPGQPLELCGAMANCYTGPTCLTHGVLRLAKPAGVTAIPGDLILGGAAVENRGDAVVWAADEQVADKATITTLGGSQPCSLDLDGHKQSLLRLVLTDAAKIRTGAGGQLKVKLVIVAGKPVPPGVYTASAGWIEGGGRVVIDPRVDVSGDAGTLAPGLTARLTGDSLLGWGYMAFDVQTNGHTAHFDSGDGNATTIAGSISGTGDVKFTMGPFRTGFRDAPMILAGDRPNTASGTYHVAKGRVQLQKPAGVDAIAGDVVVGGQGYNDCLRWENSEQIKDSAKITLIESPTNGAAYLDLNGCTETAAALTMTVNNKVKTDGPGGKGGVLKVRNLTVGGVPKPAGAYTAANAPWIEGSGKVLVQP